MVTVWSLLCVVGAMWGRSGNAESIIGGKMANVLEREENMEQVSYSSFNSKSNYFVIEMNGTVKKYKKKIENTNCQRCMSIIQDSLFSIFKEI